MADDFKILKLLQPNPQGPLTEGLVGAVTISQGSADAGKVPLLGSDGKLDISVGGGGGSSLATVATSGSYNDLNNKPTLGTAAAQNITAFDAAGSAATVQTNLTAEVSRATTAEGLLVLKTTTVNGHALSANVVVSASDITTGTLPVAQLPTIPYSDLSGTPTVPAASSTTPNMDGTAAVGSLTTYAKADHVHPSDTNRVATSTTVNGHALTGNVVVSASDITTGTLPLAQVPTIPYSSLSGTPAIPSVPINTIQNNGVAVTPASGVINLVPGSNIALTTSGDAVTIATSGLGSAAFQPSSAFDAAGAASTETTRAEAAEALLAPKASPTFTGTVSGITAVMVSALPNTTTLATTFASVAHTCLNSYNSSTGVFTAAQLATTDLSDIGTFTLPIAQVSGTLPHAQLPTLLSGDIPSNAANTTGTSANVTATTNSTLTTLSVLSLPYGQVTGTPTVPVVATTTPVMDGTATIGSIGKFADAGHIHPSDTSRQAVLGYTPLNTTNNLSDVASASTALTNLGGLSTTVAASTYAPLSGPTISGVLKVGASDTGLSRTAAGILAIGNGTASDYSGTLKLTDLLVVGTYSAYLSQNTGASGALSIGKTAGAYDGSLYCASATVGTYGVSSATGSLLFYNPSLGYTTGVSGNGANGQLCVTGTGGHADVSGNVLANQATVNEVVVSQLSTPVNAAFTTATTGGTLSAGTYYYRVVAVDGVGTSLASAETSKVTTGSTSTVTVNWTAVPGATGYKVYGRTTGAELYMATVSLNSTTTWTDTGSVTPSGALPTANTTGVVSASVVSATTYVGLVNPFIQQFVINPAITTSLVLYELVVPTFTPTALVISLPANCAGSTFSNITNPTASTTVVIAKAPAATPTTFTTIATATISTAGAISWSTGGSATTFTSGDVMKITYAGDTTACFALSIMGTHN